MKSVLLILSFVLLLGGRDVRAQEATGALDWPATTNVNRPWTRWWWQGNAVDENNLTAALEAYREAGLGGVENHADLRRGRLRGSVHRLPVAHLDGAADAHAA